MWNKVLGLLFIIIVLVSLKTSVSATESDIYNVNFTPYMKDLQIKLKENWEPALKNYDYAVVVLFRIEKSGGVG